MSYDGVICENKSHRGQGISSIDVRKEGNKVFVDVFFFTSVDSFPGLQNLKNYVILGGERIVIKINDIQLDPNKKTRVILTVDQLGDFSNYILEVQGDDIDPFYSKKPFSFRLDCEAEFDCRLEKNKEDEMIVQEQQFIDYMAKDYDSFRQSLLDLIPSMAPDWKKFSEADFGMVMIEMFSHVADELSYLQDRVGNDFALENAINRFSVKSHLALIDYTLGNGKTARTFLYFECKDNIKAVVPKGFQASLKVDNADDQIVFELDEDAFISSNLNKMTLFCGENSNCVLNQGSTSVLLCVKQDDSGGDLNFMLKKGDYVLFEEGNKKEIVKLLEDAHVIQRMVYGNSMVKIIWSEEEALENYYEYSKGAICKGNIMRASHGKTVIEPSLTIGADSQPFLPVTHGQQYVTLSNFPLTYVGTDIGAESTLQVKIDGEFWKEVPSLLEVGPNDKSYVVYVDEEGLATIIVGDGTNGKNPQSKKIYVKYMVGTGRKGNVGHDVLTEFSELKSVIKSVTNPLPGVGGEDLESIEEAKLLAPKFIRKQNRAITPADYEDAAEEHPLVSRAKARFVWTGSWYTVFVHIDPKESKQVQNQKEKMLRFQVISDEVKSALTQKKMAGYDIEVKPPHYVPLRLQLLVCVKDDFFARLVMDSVQKALGNTSSMDGTGLFYPDNITFGQKIFVSDIYKYIVDLQGVLSVTIDDFRRMTDPPGKTKEYLSKGFLEVGELEITRLDNDRNFPENGILTIRTMGGKGG